ncbi:hypothetical protein GCM10023215_02370 [Pseudonocardia yuanmonensis]|uniref:Uncharacterized protein n=1 Tax=Pseudonocardia yuanmonensis TaxID=1095914 RepID=A0ABP8VYU8_9PSEU
MNARDQAGARAVLQGGARYRVLTIVCPGRPGRQDRQHKIATVYAAPDEEGRARHRASADVPEEDYAHAETYWTYEFDWVSEEKLLYVARSHADIWPLDDFDDLWITKVSCRAEPGTSRARTSVGCSSCGKSASRSLSYDVGRDL